jgi:hypothetical protein
MKNSWLREAVDRVFAEAPHMSDEHKRKLVEAVGLELARAHARGAEKAARFANARFDNEKERARVRFKLRRSVQPNRGRDG